MHGLKNNLWRIVALGTLVVLALLPSDGIGFIICTFKYATGLDCPACGMTRALSSALHFDFIKSIDYHPGGIPVLLYLLSVLLTNGTDISILDRRLTELLPRKFHGFYTFAGCFAALWFVRVFVPEFTR